MELKFDVANIEDAPAEKTSEIYRAVLTISANGHRSINLKGWQMGMEDWAKDSLDEIIDQCPRALNLEEGEAITVFLWLKPWSAYCHTYYGDEIECGWDVIKHRTVRFTKMRGKQNENQ